MANFQPKDMRPAEQVRKELADLIRQSYTIADALKIVGRSRSWYEEQRRTDRDWAALVDQIRKRVSDSSLTATTMPDFGKFSVDYLGNMIHPHMQNMVDLLEGREPSWLPPGVVYEPGASGSSRLLINVPPNHGKTMCISIGYVTYRIIKDPNLSVIVVSKTQEMAKKIVYAVKQRLSHPKYADLQVAFGPPDGWKATADQWSATKIYLAGSDGEAKDPTLEAVGLSGQIYGARANLIVCDDIVTLANSGEHEKQMDWLRQEVASRMGPGGQLLVVGTRVSSTDLYSQLLNPENYSDGQVPWTHLSMPAVLSYAEREEDWQTLWPLADEPFVDGDEPDEDGLYSRWTGPRLARVRNEVGPKKWGLVYMNTSINEDATFNPVAVNGAVDGRRKAGPIVPNTPGAPTSTDSHYVLCSMDPAVAGNTAACAYAVDRTSGHRWVLDMRVMTGATPMQIRALIEEMTERYQPSEWIIETNAFQGFLVYDEGINAYLANKGIVMKPHRTGSNKHDPDFGVASMSGLFGTTSLGQNNIRKAQGDNLIHLPSVQAYGIKLLVEELISWSPDVPTRKRRQDTVMALWMSELRAREMVGGNRRGQSSFMRNEFLSQRDKARQMTINLDDYFSSRPQPTWV